MTEFQSLTDDLASRVFGVYGDDTAVYPGHGDDTTLHEERPRPAERRARLVILHRSFFEQVMMNKPKSPRSSMKHTISALACAGAASAIIAVASGCSAAPSTKVPTGADLKGTWNQAGDGYERGGRVTPENKGFEATVVIAEADGQSFTGYKEHTDPGEKTQKETLHGVIGLDGDILITDEDGFFTGKLVDGEIKGQYAEIGKDAAAINVELSRQ